MTQTAAGVDIVVPVYNVPEDVQRCIESVLACTSRPFTLVLIDDASPDPRIGTLFEELARRGDRRIELLRNDVNRGFTATANRGMKRSRADVVLLNSDTIVTKGWLGALLRCAASDARIATVTPFSNNAEICSFPRFCENNRLDTHSDPERIRDALERAAVPTYPDLPTGVGFCMFVRRAALDDVGDFDLTFGAGYGEENDFCLRAARAGWRNVLADDAFVVHAGERSFAGRKGDLGARNMDLLVRRHPHYPALVRDYVAADPLRPLRDAAQSRVAGDALPNHVLHVIHDHGGGTETHVRTLIDASRDRWCHYLAVAVGNSWQVDEHVAGERTRSFTFVRAEDESWRNFIGGIVATFGITLVHVHHLSRSREGALEALPALGLPYGITIHDLWLACPTVTLTPADERFCGGITDVVQCRRCLATQPAFAEIDIARWRREHSALLAGAAFLIAPSKWAADMLGRYFPEARARIDVIAHATRDSSSASAEAQPGRPVTAVLLPQDDIPVVAIVGAIGRDKGARRIEWLTQRVRDRGLRVRFVVIGYLDVQHAPWQSSDALLTVHGPYARADLPALVAHYRAAFVLYPSEGPESFSYTLSEAWHAGMPALVPPIGALAERVADSGAGWVMTHDEWHDDDTMLDRMLALLSPQAAEARGIAAAKARGASHVSPQAMAEATLMSYAKGIAKGPAAYVASPFSNRRIRDALGYRPWTPPAIQESTAETPATGRSSSVWQRIAQRALAMRRTPMGRLLYRMTPEPVIDALKARLDG